MLSNTWAETSSERTHVRRTIDYQMGHRVERGNRDMEESDTTPLRGKVPQTHVSLPSLLTRAHGTIGSKPHRGNAAGTGLRPCVRLKDVISYTQLVSWLFHWLNFPLLHNQIPSVYTTPCSVLQMQGQFSRTCRDFPLCSTRWIILLYNKIWW